MLSKGADIRWLPEPLLAGNPMLDPADTAEQRESVSYAALVLLERLSPSEGGGLQQCILLGRKEGPHPVRHR